MLSVVVFVVWMTGGLQPVEGDAGQQFAKAKMLYLNLAIRKQDKSRMWEILKPAGLDPSKKSVSLKAKKMGVWN